MPQTTSRSDFETASAAFTSIVDRDQFGDHFANFSIWFCTKQINKNLGHLPVFSEPPADGPGA
jgi:hypothetical protein